MKTIPLSEAFKLIEDSSAVIIDDDSLMYAATSELTGEADNEFLFVSWIDSDGYEFRIVVREGENQSVRVDEGGLILVDDEGDEFKVTILRVHPVQA